MGVKTKRSLRGCSIPGGLGHCQACLYGRLLRIENSHGGVRGSVQFRRRSVCTTSVCSQIQKEFLAGSWWRLYKGVCDVVMECVDSTPRSRRPKYLLAPRATSHQTTTDHLSKETHLGSNPGKKHTQRHTTSKVAINKHTSTHTPYVHLHLTNTKWSNVHDLTPRRKQLSIVHPPLTYSKLPLIFSYPPIAYPELHNP